MKRLYTLFVVLLTATVTVLAQDAEIAAVKSLNTKNKTLRFDFKETAFNKATNKTSTLKGVLFFSADKKLSMKYTDPAGDYKLIADGKFTQQANGKHVQATIKQKGQIAQLAGLLTNVLAGDVKAVADLAPDAQVKASVEADKYVFVITSDKGMGNIKQLTLKYAKSDGVLYSLRIDYQKGKYNLYEQQGGKQVNATLPADAFVAPAKK
ncbi:MAG: outer membrane lipoprotein carrier protein LolA [Paludibacteraceae bacterium]|nr:outer membrane lipoprotein carrier protein LolA [Paludibacteraceae bacterium]